MIASGLHASCYHLKLARKSTKPLAQDLAGGLIPAIEACASSEYDDAPLGSKEVLLQLRIYRTVMLSNSHGNCCASGKRDAIVILGEMATVPVCKTASKHLEGLISFARS